MVEKPAWPANQLVPYEFDQAQCRASLEEFAKLLDSQQELEEQKDILPFFRNHPHLAALFSTYNINIGAPNRLAFELDLFGKFRADLVIGDAETGNFVFVEFEEAKVGSIFRQRTQKGRLTPYWSDRFEQGFGQIVDWFRLTDDQRRTPEFEELFGVGDN